MHPYVMNSGEGWRLGHRPALDGLRGVAILFVLCAHFDDPRVNPLTGAGAVGVTAFFTLSGFLITSLLLEEHGRAGRVSFAAFYRRRAFRLFPALAAVLTAVLLAQATWKSLGVSDGHMLAALFYVSNWWNIHHAGFDALTPTWSLAIEEQFYLVWPALFLLGVRWGRRGVSWVIAGGLVVSVVAMMAPGSSPSRGSLEQASTLLIGCALAVWMSGQRESRSRPWLAAVALGVLVPLMWLEGTVPVEVYVLGVPIATAVILWSSAQGSGVGWLSGSALRWFGRRSYGIYLWNYPVIFMLPGVPGPWWVRTLVLVPLALGVAELSGRFVEDPIRRLGHRSGKRQDRSPVPVARQGVVESLNRGPVPIT